jgi:WD40 repeat protein
MVLLSDGKICSVSSDRTLKMWNIETVVCDLTVQISGSGLYCVVQLRDGRLVVSSNDWKVHIVG